MKFTSGLEHGEVDGVEFKVERVDRIYKVVDIEDEDKIDFAHLIHMFSCTCGKYEVEEFLTNRLLIDLKVKKDICDLMGMSVYFNDLPYNETLIGNGTVRKIILSMFETIHADLDIVYLKFVGRK